MWGAAIAELKVAAATDDGTFFGRETELGELLTRVKEGKQIVVLLGPNDSGKSAILQKFKRLWEANDGVKKRSPVFYLDMRLSDVRTPALAAVMIGVQLRTWLGWLQETAAAAAKSLKATMNGVTFDAAGLAGGLAQKSDLSSVLHAFNALTYENPDLRPVFIIDEVDKLKTWDSYLDVFMENFVAMTKQDNKAMVILSSSDEFFRHWFKAHVGSLQWTPLGVGYFSKDNARKFYTWLWERRDNNRKVEAAEWEDVYATCGGDPLALWKFVSEVSTLNRDPKEVLEGLVDATIELVHLGVQGGAWEGQKFKALAQLIVDKQGAVGRYRVCKELFDGDEIKCRKQLQSMLKANVIHVRYAPGGCYYDDFSRGKSRESEFAMARSPPHLKAMELYLNAGIF